VPGLHPRPRQGYGVAMATTTRRPPATAAPPARLTYTGDDEADRLLAADPTAMLIGFVLDQQVTVQHAFHGPLELRRRIGTLDPGAIARMDPGRLAAAFAQRPAIHRFPAAMAQRVQALCALIVDEYGGDASRLWTEAGSGEELWRRLSALPGFGPMKARTLVRLLSHQYGVHPPGYEAYLPGHPTLGDVTTVDELNAYQTAKRAHKAKLRAEAAAAGAAPSRGRGARR